MDLSTHLNEHAGRYAEPEEDDRLSSLADSFVDGSWTTEDIEWIVRWKSPRVMGYFSKNDPDTVRERVEDTLATRRIRQKMNHLTSLDGVGVRVASAILTFMDPTQFTVMDRRAWQALVEMGYLPEGFATDPDVDAYLVYLGVCWALSNEHDVSLRTLNRALWDLGETV